MKIFKIILLGIVVLLSKNLLAAVPNWSINPNAFQYTMSVTASAKFNCDPSTNPNNLIGAFINNNLAGYANINTNINGQMYAYVTVYSNVSGGDTVKFKMYDAVNDTLLDSKYTAIFQENASIGNASVPFVHKSDYELQEITINTDTIFEYNLAGDSVVSFQVKNENMEFEIASFSFVNSAFGSDNNFFTFTDSFLIMTQNVDFLNKDFYNIHIQSTNSRGCSIDTALVIIVKNTNVPPTGVLPNPANINENQMAGTLVTQLTAIDNSPNDSHFFELSNDFVNFPDNDFFSIVNDSLVADTNFNFEAQSDYVLQIIVTDNLLGTHTDTVMVEINDLVEFTDFIENPAYIDENQYPGTFVSALTPINISSTDTHTYNLSTDTLNFPDNNAFVLVNDTLWSNQNFDFEIKNQYILLIEVADQFGTLYLDTFTVYINGLIEFTDFVDNPVNFNENQDSGILVTQFVPVGVLPIDTHTFVLSADTLNFPDNNAFTISTDSLFSNWNYDFETQDSYTLEIEVRDKFGTLYLDTFVVNINDLTEFTDFVENPTSFDENQNGGLLVSTLTPLGLLPTDTHTYVLSADTLNFPDNNAFSLNSDSLFSNWNYDFESQSIYTLLIEVRDRFDTMYLDTFIVNINDLIEFTTFEENPVTVDENSGPEILVSSLTAFALPSNHNLNYTLSEDSFNFPDNNFFWVLNDSLFNKFNFDYEIQDSYELLIEVRDQFDTLYLDTFLVFINDIEEFEYFEEDPIYFDENQNLNSLVSKLTPIRSLIGDALTFELSKDTFKFPDNNSFTISADELLSAEVFNYEEKNEYSILVEVTNEFGTRYFDTLTIFINDVIEVEDLKANNVITPNNDGYNDYFAVPNVELFENFEFVIYNENGNLIYRRSASSGYNNLWNGKTTNGEELPQGVYYYLLKSLYSEIEFKGEITLLKD